MRHLILPAAVLLIACNGENDTSGNGDGTFDISVVIPQSYTDFHSANAYQIGVLDSEGTFISGFGSDTVETGEAVEFTLEEGTGYQLHFWIDANLSGGTVDVCDGAPDFFDHQWEYTLGTVDADREFTFPAHNTTFQDVCATFADL